ncbi:hypothetical protein [Allorhizocola rhizosphaerae]|uniref:hypothetical protein n=1 Tax=Allorhizocola rhizosphaerae TaxID=1872709 RepID=UPI000E3C0031|nr:hypothetical protein [Allorhizocola rhizosphaerae]
MSGGAVLFLPAGAVLAAGAAVVVGAAAAAFLIARAANGAAEGAVRAIGDYGAELERQVAGQANAELNSALWSALAADVVELNARIRMFKERTDRAGAAVTLPEPMSMAGRSTGEVVSWLSTAAGMLTVAQQAMYEVAMLRNTMELPGAATTPSATANAFAWTAAALARHQETLRNRYTRGTTVASVSTADSSAIEAALAGLDPDASESDHAEVLRLAAKAGGDDPREAASFLLELELSIEATNAKLARRRLAAQWLSALEDPIVARVDPPAPLLGTAARLHAVVIGEADLTPALRSEGLEAVEWAAETTRQHFVRETVRRCLTEQGYTVEEEFDVRHHAGLRMSRTDWRGENSAKVWVDSEGLVHGRLYRHVDQLQGDEALLRNRSRCDEFNRSLTALGQTLQAEVRVDSDRLPQYLAPANAAELGTTTSSITIAAPQVHHRQVGS